MEALVGRIVGRLVGRIVGAVGFEDVGKIVEAACLVEAGSLA